MDVKSVLALVWVVGVKLLGYWGAGRVLKGWYSATEVNAFHVGAFRTFLGWLGGAVVMGVAVQSSSLFLPMLAIARFTEWSITVGLFFEKPYWELSRAMPRLAAMLGWSCVLDIPAALGLLPIIGSMHFC